MHRQLHHIPRMQVTDNEQSTSVGRPLGSPSGPVAAHQRTTPHSRGRPVPRGACASAASPSLEPSLSLTTTLEGGIKLAKVCNARLSSFMEA